MQAICSTCGSTLVIGDNTIITNCAFCGSNQIIKGHLTNEFKPNKIIPFKYGIDTFEERIQDYINLKDFCYNDFLNDLSIISVKGIYVPFIVCKVKCENEVKGEIINNNSDENSIEVYSNYIYANYNFEGNISFDTG